MANVSVSITLKSQSFAAGTAGGLLQVKLFKSDGSSAGVVNISPPLASPAVANFANVADGSYTGTVQRFSTALQPLGASVSFAFGVTAAAAVDVDVPDVVSVTVTP